ncbi:MAG: CCA tRNA nucleotidyltransferase [Planctomycetaceae bacterium]|nr:CCA tRNA nucleotidyltransferase [Planctomycetaceae bacterium]
MTEQRTFAVTVVRRLRDAGFESLWAGGCVRDALLGRVPGDYDVATSARPEQVIDLFGRRLTVPVGVSFGVVMVLDESRKSPPVEVATFRSDGAYVDGRRPESVVFSSPEEDARRRDFTINGMFYDPLNDELIDYVGGQEDLKEKVVRAIGNAADRFAEDKLRMLRAIRFAATYSFRLDESTFTAARNLAQRIVQVSVERIAQELRRMLAHRSRRESLSLLESTGLLEVIFPFTVALRKQGTLSAVERCWEALEQPAFEPSLATLFRCRYLPDAPVMKDRTKFVRAECRNLRLSNDETDTVCRLTEQTHRILSATDLPLHVLKPLLANERSALLIDLVRATELAADGIAHRAGGLSEYQASHTPEQLNPPPLIDGRDLMALGIPSGPLIREVLTAIRNEQLDEQLQTRDAALARVRVLATQDSLDSSGTAEDASA